MPMAGRFCGWATRPGPRRSEPIAWRGAGAQTGGDPALLLVGVEGEFRPDLEQRDVGIAARGIASGNNDGGD